MLSIGFRVGSFAGIQSRLPKHSNNFPVVLVFDTSIVINRLVPHGLSGRVTRHGIKPLNIVLAVVNCRCQSSCFVRRMSSRVDIRS